MMKEIRWGIIGCGDVTEVKSGPAFQQIKGSKLVAVMRRDAAKAADYAKRHKVGKWYSNADELINDPDVNAIYIATPPDAHAFYTLRALQARKPVYVEKPMALNTAQAQQMVEASRKYKLPVYVAYYRRALSDFLKVKELIESGQIGEVSQINLQLHLPPRPEDYNKESLPWRVLSEKAGGGYFYDLASHQLDYLHFLFGKAEVIHSKTENRCGLYAAEDYVKAELHYPKGIALKGSWNFCSKEEEQIDRIEIIGNRGSIRFSTFDSTPIELKTAQGERMLNFDKPTHIQKQLIEQVVNALQGEKECVSTAETAFETNRLMEQIIAGQTSDSN